MLNWIKAHKKQILAVVAALIVPGGLIVLAAGVLKKYFGRKAAEKK